MRGDGAMAGSTRASSLQYALDFTAFAASLALAYALGWRATDLVWGLWLSSLVVGWLMLLVGIAGAARRFVMQLHGSVAAALGGSVLLLVFFTVHFGGFHLVHSVFLSIFFPIQGAAVLSSGLYATVFANYWPWLLPAALAERRAFVDGWTGGALPPNTPEQSKPRLGFHPLTPYRSVLRMHVLIFAFAGLWALGVDQFAVYALVYAVYFWPRRQRAVATPA